MKKKSIVPIMVGIILILVIAVISVGFFRPFGVEFSRLWKNQDLNNSIELINIDQSEGKFTDHSVISLVIRNNSSHNVIFPGDFNIRILLFSDGVWKDGYNCMTYYLEEIAVLPIKEYRLGELFEVIPCNGHTDDTIPIKIEISGHLDNLFQTPVKATFEGEIVP